MPIRLPGPQGRDRGCLDTPSLGDLSKCRPPSRSLHGNGGGKVGTKKLLEVLQLLGDATSPQELEEAELGVPWTLSIPSHPTLQHQGGGWAEVTATQLLSRLHPVGDAGHHQLHVEQVWASPHYPWPTLP